MANKSKKAAAKKAKTIRTHTPGPWEAIDMPQGVDNDGHNEEAAEIVQANTTGDGDGTGDTVAYVVGNQADCNLIAAAPDLLAALERCLSELEGIAEDGEVEVDGARVEAARAAVAKARGA